MESACGNADYIMLLFYCMRMTIEIDESNLSQIQKITGEKRKSPAVSRALTEYLNWRRRHQFLERVRAGKTDYTLSNEDLEARDGYQFGLAAVSAARQR
jgi:Arc/MetJ family transcription regulator